MENLEYNQFVQACIEDLKVLQEKFKNDYDVDWYDNWFYDQTTGLLTFSTGSIEINFRYFDIGSFSEESNTWKWSWDNDTTLESVKEQAHIIRKFGEESNYSKLTRGYFPSDEFDAWEFVAIAAKLTNAIGVYRPVSAKRLQIFLVITEFIDNEKAKKIKDKYIQCDKHQTGRIAFVCKHINGKNKVGFHEAFETFQDMELSEDEDFAAWCNECKVVRHEEGEWNDKSMAFADIKVVCEKCYFEMKELNLGHV